ncbi:MAG: hypothetical protein AUH77_08475 [Candidatus Rokubacteria bacterium 13_1_40CM_4_69_39]|nr:MAG: hypothetical protein AUH77_08475 [Candidatus Rokubacteria bacterium 13_1_40CM_4_69_39]
MADGRPLEDQMAEALAQQAQTQQATTQQPMMLRDALGREVPLSAERQALLRKRTQPQPKAQGATERPPALHADDPAAGDARLAALLKAPAYLDKNHVDHAKAVTDVREYLQQKYQEPDAADLADAPDIGELRRFVGAELPWMPAHAEAKWDVVAEEDFLNFAVQENLRTITVNQLMSWYVDRALVYGGFGPGAEAAFREFAKGKLSDAHVEKLIAWGRVIHSEET